MEEFIRQFLGIVVEIAEWTLFRVADWFITHFLG